MISLLLKRAENEIVIADNLKRMSENSETKTFMDISQDMTFYSAVISHSYYAIFYSAKAYLLSKNILLKSEQGQHQQVYFGFRKFVENGEIEKELLRIYEENKLKAEFLLEIMKNERGKRKDFTYETIPQANKPPAEESLKNAKFFVSNIIKVIGDKQSPN